MEVDKRIKNLKNFAKGVSGNPKGRPKNRVKEMLEQKFTKKKLRTLYGFSHEEIEMIERCLLPMNIGEIKEIAKSDDLPVYMYSLARAIITDVKSGRTYTLDRLRERQYGMAKQNVEVSGELNFGNFLKETGVIENE